MNIVFFVSSVGDTDLARASINKLLEQKFENQIHLIPISTVAEKRTEDLIALSNVKRVRLAEILNQEELSTTRQLTANELAKVNNYISQNKIHRAYVGVPSPLEEEFPYQIAAALEVPCIIAYEYMFTAPEKHHFWQHLDSLANNRNCSFAVPLPRAKNDILKFNQAAKIETIGHVSIDQAMVNKNIEISSIKNSLLIKEQEELIFISATTQPPEVDNQFIAAVLSELETGKYPQLQIRFGLHPGIKDLDGYLEIILKTCEKYPATAKQFKIILPSHLENKLQKTINNEHLFILRTNISGTEASHAANKIAQAVPGALLNEAAIKGKPSYFHEKFSTPYLPKAYFSENIATFFKAEQQPQHTRKEMELEEETAADKMANLMVK